MSRRRHSRSNHACMQGKVEPLETWQGLYHVQPVRRGDYAFGNITLRWLGPLGLVHRQRRVRAAEGVKVYPNLLDVRKYDLLLRRNRLQEIGLRSTRMFGEGTEFERLREYLPDDEYRSINWKATARRHHPVTVQYQTERSQNVIAVLDTGRMMQTPVADIAKLDYAVNAVLFLGYVATGKGDRVGVMSFADDVEHYLAPRQGRGQFYRMLELLYAVEARQIEPNYRKALTYLAIKQRRRALVVIFTDLSSGLSLDSLVAQVSLLARSSLPLVVTISDPDVHAAAAAGARRFAGGLSARGRLPNARRTPRHPGHLEKARRVDPGCACQSTFIGGCESLSGIERPHALMSGRISKAFHAPQKLNRCKAGCRC